MSCGCESCTLAWSTEAVLVYLDSEGLMPAIDGDRVKVYVPTGYRMSEDTLDLVRAHRDELLAILEAEAIVRYAAGVER